MTPKYIWRRYRSLLRHYWRTRGYGHTHKPVAPTLRTVRDITPVVE